MQTFEAITSAEALKPFGFDGADKMKNKFFLNDMPIDYIYDLRSDVANGETDEIKAWRTVLEWLDSPEYVSQDGFTTGKMNDDENPEEAAFLCACYDEAERHLTEAEAQCDEGADDAE